MEVKSNFAIGKKEIFDNATKQLLIKAINASTVKQTEDGDVEHYSIIQNGKEIGHVRENFVKGRSTIAFNGKVYTKVDKTYVTGEINKRTTLAESPDSLNTINEKDFVEIYSLVASKTL